MQLYILYGAMTGNFYFLVKVIDIQCLKIIIWHFSYHMSYQTETPILG